MIGGALRMGVGLFLVDELRLDIVFAPGRGSGWGAIAVVLESDRLDMYASVGGEA